MVLLTVYFRLLVPIYFGPTDRLFSHLRRVGVPRLTMLPLLDRLADSIRDGPLTVLNRHARQAGAAAAENSMFLAAANSLECAAAYTRRLDILIYIYIYLYIYICIYIYLYMHTYCMYTYICIYLYMYKNSCIYIHTNVLFAIEMMPGASCLILRASFSSLNFFPVLKNHKNNEFHTNAHVLKHTDRHARTHTHSCVRTPIHTHARTHAHPHTCTHAYTKMHTNTHRYTDTQTHRHTDTQTRRHTDTQTRRHTDT